MHQFFTKNSHRFIHFLIICLLAIPLLFIIKKFFFNKKSFAPSVISKTNETIKHLGVIMDGNRRWAKKRNISVVEGYKAGAEKFFELLRLCLNENIPVLTVYALSLDNVKKRHSTEIQTIIETGEKLLQANIEWFIENNIKINIVGNKEVFKTNSEYEKTLHNVLNACEKTKNCDQLTVNILVAYGSIDDSTHSVREIAKKVKSGDINIDDINETLFQEHMLSHQVPKADLVIRTGYHERLSDFIPMQSSYAEIKFFPILWPDIDMTDVKQIIHNFANVERNFGK